MQRDVPVREVMDREFVAASPSDELLETVELLLREEAEPAVVLEGSEFVGVLGDRDALAAFVGGDAASATVGDAMTDSVPTAAPDETLDEARDRMATWSTRWLVVAEGAEPQGVVTEHDVLAGTAIGSEAETTEDVAPAQEELAGTGTTAAAAEANASAAGGFEDQGICEKCGTLNRDLTSFNGALLCADCRDV